MTRTGTWVASLAVALGMFAACGGSTTNEASSTTGGGGSTSGSLAGPTTTTGSSASSVTVGSTSSVASSSAASTGSASGGGGASSSGSGGGGGAPPLGGCWQSAPPGATLAADPPTYAGTCPMLTFTDGTAMNTITSSGNQRQFMLAGPSNIDPSVPLPVVFMWHWLKGSASDFYDKGQVAQAVEQQNFIAVLPQAKGDLLWEWPFAISDTQARQDEESQFFDDMLACVAQQFNINKECVSSVGVSAGALFTDQLAGARGDHLASIESLSGGVDASFIKPWGHPAHHMPAMVLWGGAMDTCIVINFQTASQALEMGLEQDGNFILECIHNCGHGEPPFDTPMGMSEYAGLWDFVFDHPFWLKTGQSPYIQNGLPTALPSWCAIGAGNAVERTGMCDPPGC